MKTKKKYITFIAVLILLVTSIFTETAFAAATASISGGGNYKVGQTVTVNFTYGGVTYGTAKTTFRYNTSVLQFQSCSAQVYNGT